MTQYDYNNLSDGDLVITNHDPAWQSDDWRGVLVVVRVDEQGRRSFHRQSDNANCGPGPIHIELYKKAKIKPLPLPG